MPVPGEGKLAGRSRRGECPPEGGWVLLGVWVLPRGGVGCFGVGGGGVLSSPRCPADPAGGRGEQPAAAADRSLRLGGAGGQHHHGHGAAPPVPQQLLEDPVPPAAHGRAPALPQAPLHRHHGERGGGEGGARPLGRGPLGSPRGLRGPCRSAGLLLGGVGVWDPWVGTPRGGGPEKLENPFWGLVLGCASPGELGADFWGRNPLSGPSSPGKPPVGDGGGVVASPRACTGVGGSLGSAGGG